MSTRRLTVLVAALVTLVTMALPATQAAGSAAAEVAGLAAGRGAGSTAVQGAGSAAGQRAGSAAVQGAGSAAVQGAGSAAAPGAGSAAASTGTAVPGGGAAQAGATGFDPLPSLPVNACQDSSLPRSYGTNFPVPSDPYGFGFANQTVIGWEGNYYAPFAYLSGSYFARGVPAHYQSGGRAYCGAMYSFGVYDYGLATGQAPAAGSVQWTMADGYLPALTTSFTRNGVAVSITDFADKQTIDGGPAELVYTRVSVTNNSAQAVSVPPGASGPGLVTLPSGPDSVQPGQTVQHDFAAAVDTFSVGDNLPTAADVSAQAAGYDSAYAHMKAYWNQRLSVIPKLSLPDVTLPGTGLDNPGDAIDNAYKAAFAYTRIVQVGKAPFSGANNYDWLLNHDLPSILANRFQLGDFTDAQNLLLAGRISEQPGFSEVGANWYWDGLWKTPVAWADYLAGTGDVSFVSKYFHDDTNGPGEWGPSLYTIMHKYYLSQLDPATGYLQASGDNDSGGTWLFDDEAALAGLAAYRYIAARIGEPGEARWAGSQYTSLLNATNAGLAANEKANSFRFLPCEVDQPTTADRCNTASDANWAGSNLWSQNVWDVYLQGGQLSGILGDPSQTDNLYMMGFSRLAGSVPYPSFGAYSGYSVALNTGYAAAALYGSQYRDLPVTSYAWQIQHTTGGPNAWWEANGSPPDPNNPWAGSHAAPQFGAIPYAWPMASQTQTLLQSLAAQGLVHDTGGSPGYHTALYVGRGVPDAWIVPGQEIAVSNLTSSYDVSTGARSTYGVAISVRGTSDHRVVAVQLSGQVPSRDVKVQLPVFADAGVVGVDGGSFDAATHTVTLDPGGNEVTVRLGNASRPGVAIHVDSTVPGQHVLPTLVSGTQTTTTATVSNTGNTEIRNVQVVLQAPGGWLAQPASPASFDAIEPGQSKTVTWSVTPPSDATGGNGLIVSTSYQADNSASGTVNAEQWVKTQRPLPLPPGATDLALTAAPSASYTSPWEHVTAINDGIYPPSSNDTENTRWGCWPQQGEQWIELDWNQPVTTNGSSVYFFVDGGGVLLPSSWKVQYWDGSSFVDVPNASGYPLGANTFNQVTFGPVTTTRLRVILESGQASVGVLEWIVPSIPGSG
jgi:NPCBM-associated, NEW3 domain of alpha-galactosidase